VGTGKDVLTQVIATWPMSPTAYVLKTIAFMHREKRYASLVCGTEIIPVVLSLVCHTHIPVEA